MQRRPTVKSTGALGRENVGMSNRKSGESPDRRKPEVSSAMSIIGGLGDPKDNPAQLVYKLARVQLPFTIYHLPFIYSFINLFIDSMIKCLNQWELENGKC